MYGLAQHIPPRPTPAADAAHGTRHRHIVFVDRSGLHRRPLDLGPIADVGTRTSAPTAVRPATHILAADAEDLVRWLFRQASLDADHYGHQTLARRLPACLRLLRVPTPALARQTLEAQPDRIPAALATFLIGVTSFFRDPAVFDSVARDVLPDLAARARARGDGRIRVLSVGCSDGRELYSVAMLAAETGLLPHCELTGTDCRPDALRRARDAAYDEHDVRDLPPGRRGRFFRRDGDGEASWRLIEPLRVAARWHRADATAWCPAQPERWDLILCRNMAMYLRPEPAARLWRDLTRAVRPGGYLVTGKAERPAAAERLSPVAPCVYRRDWT